MSGVGVPTDEAQKNLIDKVAQYVAKNGDEFATMMMKKQQGNPEYDFLNRGGSFNKYFESKVKTERIAWKITSQREAAAQAARDLVAQSHTNWKNQAQKGAISQPSKELKNPWNPNLKTGSSWSGSKTGWGGAGNPSIPTSNLSTSGSGWKPEDSNPPPITTETLDKMKRDYEKKRNEFDSNVKESDSNLKEQRKSLMTDKENRVDEVIEKKLIHDCSKEAIKLNINLDEFHKILRPVVKYCTKESIAAGKAWIIDTGRDTKSARLICKYISARVLSNSATFEMRLHTIYLINDVLYHANKKNNRTVLSSFEEIIVPLWSITKLRADKEIGDRLVKLKDLWKDNHYFSSEVEERFNMHIVEYKQFRDNLRSKYSREVKQAEEEFDSQFKNYEQQHAEYVQHTERILKEELKLIEDKEEMYSKWETKMEKMKEKDLEELKKNQEGLEKYKKQLNKRAQCNSQGQNTNFGPMGQPWDGDESGLIPNRKYYELPAGLMAACIPLQKKQYEPIDTRQLRLVPHIQPSQKLLEALDEFYRPLPTQVVMKNGWPNGSLDEFYDAKEKAISDLKRDYSNVQSDSKPSTQSGPPPRKSRFSGIKSH